MSSCPEIRTNAAHPPAPVVLILDATPAQGALWGDALRTRGRVSGVVSVCSADPELHARLCACELVVCAGGATRLARLDGLHRVRTMRPEAPVVFVAPPDDPESAEIALDLGATDALVACPGAIEQLPLCAHKVIRRSRQIAELARTAGEILDDNQRLRDMVAQLKELAASDPLTGLLNRRGVGARLTELLSAADRYASDLSVAVIDLDGLKRVNDRLGHQQGDRLLRAAGDAIRAGIRGSDVGARVGGDEFVLLMPYTQADQAAMVCKRVRSLFTSAAEVILAEAEAESGQPAQSEVIGSAGMSIGVTSRTLAPHCSGDELLSRADRAMYDAKKHAPGSIRIDPGAAGPRLAAA